MVEVPPGPILTPHFRDFLPAWVARQPWYAGAGTPSLSPVGFFRFEDPAGEVGIETHLVSDGSELYQLPMTYRAEPVHAAGAGEALVAKAEHSVLGTRWIYDGVVDPVWAGELLSLIRTNGVADVSGKPGVGPVAVRGHPLTSRELTLDTVRIELKRVVRAAEPVEEPDVVGRLIATWAQAGPDCCLAVLWAR